MYCGKCGVKNPDYAKFCRACGQPMMKLNGMGAASPQNKSFQQTQSVPPESDAQGREAPNAGLQMAGLADNFKKLPKKYVAAGVAVAVLFLVFILIAVRNSKTINLNKYLTIEASGYEGIGKVEAKIDWDAIEKKYGSKIAFTKKGRDEYVDEWEEYFDEATTPVEVIADEVTITLDKETGLSNGDKVNYTVEVDEKELSKFITGKVKAKNGTYKVSGLEELAKFDAFADLQVEFSGTEPKGTANLNYVGSELDYYDFSYEPREGLSNGDVITVKIDDSRIEQYAQKLKKVPETLEKEYTVEGLPHYLDKIGDLEEKNLQTLVKQGEDVFRANVARYWDDGAKLETFTYLGNYLLTPKEDNGWRNKNQVVLVYKAQVRTVYSDNAYNKLNDLYWFAIFRDVLLNPDGTMDVELTSCTTPNNEVTVSPYGENESWRKKWYFRGFENMKDLYEDAVTSQADQYNHEDNVDESVTPSASENETEATDATAENGGYIIPDSDKRLLEKKDLEGLSAEEIKLARNELYARHGRKFKDEALQAHFDSCDWYEGTIEADDFDELAEFSDIEMKNKDFIVKYEAENAN